MNIAEEDLHFLESLNFDGFYNDKMPEPVYYELPEYLITSVKKNLDLLYCLIIC